METIGTKILDILNVTSDDDTNSVIAKTMVLQARKKSNFMELLMSEPEAQVMWIDAFSNDNHFSPIADKFQELETISSFLRTLKVIRNVYVEEGWL